MSAVILKRRGRGKAQASFELIHACHEILAEIQPASVGAVCYRLFTMGMLADMSEGSTNKVSNQYAEPRNHALRIERAEVDSIHELVQAWQAARGANHG